MTLPSLLFLSSLIQLNGLLVGSLVLVLWVGCMDGSIQSHSSCSLLLCSQHCSTQPSSAGPSSQPPLSLPCAGLTAWTVMAFQISVSVLLYFPAENISLQHYHLFPIWNYIFQRFVLSIWMFFSVFVCSLHVCLMPEALRSDYQIPWNGS